MSSRMSILHQRVDDLVSSTPLCSSPVRRRSKIAQVTLASSLVENDDEAELLVRRLENSSQQSAQPPDRRRSLGISLVTQMSNPQISEKIQQCIQLNAENKINLKNAFSLQMIDFMNYMIKKKVGMNDLAVATTSLDVSTKIYGLRVDGMHLGIMKMSCRNDPKKSGDALEDDNVGTGDNEGDAQVRTKKKRKNKQKIILEPESLKGPTETVNPYTSMMALGDTQTTDMLYLATIPYHANRGGQLYLYDHAVLETVLPEKEGNLSSISTAKINCHDSLGDSTTFGKFELLGWSVDDEKESSTPVEPINGENGYQFDLDASLPPEEEPSNAGMNFFDIDNDEDVEGCERVAQAPVNIIDFRESLQTASRKKNFEYSYFQDNMDILWAGPSHWKIRHPTKNLINSRVVGRCEQEPIRRRKELILAYNDESGEAGRTSFAIARGNINKLQTKTTKNAWIDERITMPQDMHYAVADTCKFYGRPEVTISFPQKEDVANATHVSDEIGNYDYNNEHDTTDYCPNVGCDGQPDALRNNSINLLTNEGDNDELSGFPTQAFTGDNLVEVPKLTNEIILAYAQRAKKIDMRQLKKCLWKNLTDYGARNEDKENTDSVERRNADTDKVSGTVMFSQVFEELPKTLNKNNTEALSVPLAFASLLHLANEKNLKLNTNNIGSDIFVQQM